MDLSDMNSFFAQNFYRAEELDENGVTATIVRVETQTFNERGRNITRPILDLDNGRAVVCNQKRGQTMIDAFGKNGNGWVGRTIRVWQGETFFEGRKVPCIEIGPVVSGTAP
jgi:hypothetical protein